MDVIEISAETKSLADRLRSLGYDVKIEDNQVTFSLEGEETRRAVVELRSSFFPDRIRFRLIDVEAKPQNKRGDWLHGFNGA